MYSKGKRWWVLCHLHTDKPGVSSSLRTGEDDICDYVALVIMHAIQPLHVSV